MRNTSPLTWAAEVASQTSATRKATSVASGRDGQQRESDRADPQDDRTQQDVAVVLHRYPQSVVFSFGSGDLNGPSRGFVDRVVLTHPASS